MQMDRSKMDVAKEVLSELVDSLRNYPNLEVALRVYGNNPLPNRDACDDTTLEVPFKINNHDEIIKKLGTIEPKGGTPIAYSLEQTVNDFPKDGLSYNVVILITDGAESCKGDPCTVSRKLQEAGVFLEPYIISLDMKGEFRDMFNCLGQQYTANDIPSFKGALDESVRKTLEGPTVTIEILNGRGIPYKSDLTVNLYNKKTGELKYQLIHYMSPQGTTDTLLLPPGIDYNIELSTVPPLKMSNVRFIEGKHTNYRIPAPQGILDIFMQNATYYKKPLTALVKSVKDGHIFHSQSLNSRQKYLAGIYDLEVTTRPPSYFKSVEVSSDATSIIRIKEPGFVSVNHRVPGFLSIYSINGQELELVENFEVKGPSETITLQPGKYQLAFRAKNAKGSKFTVVKKFDITSRTTSRVSIY